MSNIYSCFRSNYFKRDKFFFTHSELLSGLGSWFLWPVVFATTLQMTAVLPNTLPSKNSAQKKQTKKNNRHTLCQLYTDCLIMFLKYFGTSLTRPISEVQETTIVLGTVVDSRTRDVILMGRLGLFGSTPFLVGGRYPYRQQKRCLATDGITLGNFDKINNMSELTGRLQGLPLTFTHKFGGKWSSCGQLVSDKQNLKSILK